MAENPRNHVKTGCCSTCSTSISPIYALRLRAAWQRKKTPVLAHKYVHVEEFIMTPSYEFASPVHRWNQMYNLWLATLPADRTVVVRQEDQLGDQVRVLAAAQRKLGLTPSGPLQAITQRVDVEATLVATLGVVS